MKLSLTQENLAKALNVVGRIVSTRSSLPVLSNVLLSTDANRLKLSATNLEIGINYWVGSKVDEEGSLTVPARLFAEYVSSLPAGKIELSSEDMILSVTSPHYSSNINGISAEEFPLIPEIKSNPVLSLPAVTFRDALQQVVPAASLDEARPVLAGVYMFIDGGSLMLVATDSYRLAEKSLKLSKKASSTKLDVIVPARTMQELGRILNDTESEVNIYVNENQVMFEVDSIELTSRLIEGQYPNYKQIIPSSAETEFEIDLDEFVRVTKVASLFARESAGSVRLEIKEEGKISIVAAASQVGENNSSAEAEVRGEDNEVSLNSRYLLDALGAVKAQKVNFAVSGKLNPCVLRPAEGKDDDYIHIIMPLRT